MTKRIIHPQVHTGLQGGVTSGRTALPSDLREFLLGLEALGLLVRLQEAVDWKCELGARARVRQKPLLFENIRGYPGRQVFANGLCEPASIALALGFDPATPYRTMISACRKRLAESVQPAAVATAPFLDNILEGEAVDFLRFPVPQWSDRDGGRYLGTWHINVTQDPECGERNIGVYRMQVLDARHATVSASAGSGLIAHLTKAERKGQPLPMAVAIGVPEAVVIAGAAACPAGMDEYGLAGALQQAPVPVMECAAVGLEVPATSEIVIEGQILPHVRAQDGPFFDYCGALNTDPAARVFEASRILFRNSAIFRGAAVGVAGAEDHQLFAFLAQLGLVDFHKPRAKQRLQNLLWKGRQFRAIQAIGNAHRVVRTLLKTQSDS